jgi:Fis family transcriptional regulator
MKKKNNLADSVRANLTQYLSDLGDADPVDMYSMVIHCVEKPLLEIAMTRAEGNQSRAADMLGITRLTLRKKLVSHDLL